MGHCQLHRIGIGYCIADCIAIGILEKGGKMNIKRCVGMRYSKVVESTICGNKRPLWYVKYIYTFRFGKQNIPYAR